MGSEHYCLRWNNHQSNLLGVFSQLLRDESLVDVTLACSEGHSIRAHKVVLSACSSYFQTLFVDHPSRHPIVILKDVRFAELRTLIEFMYKGEVNVEYCQLSALLKTAESLKVKGLAEMTRDCKPEYNKHQHHHHHHHQQHQQHHRLKSEQLDDEIVVRDSERRDLDDDEEEIGVEEDGGEQLEPTELVTRKQQTIQVVGEMVAAEMAAGGRSTPKLQHQQQTAPISMAPLAATAATAMAVDSPSMEKETCNVVVGSEEFESESMCSDTDMPNDMTTSTTTTAVHHHHHHHNNACVSSTHLPPPPSVGRLSPPSSSSTSQQQQQQQQQSGPTSLVQPQLSQDSMPGTSSLPPVQQVPLSLKKEVDWGGGADEKNIKDPPDFCRSQESESCPHSSSACHLDKPSSSEPMIASNLTINNISNNSNNGASIAAAAAAAAAFASASGIQFPSFGTSLLEIGLLQSGLLAAAAAASANETAAADHHHHHHHRLYRCASCMAAFPSVWLLEQHNALQHVVAGATSSSSSSSPASGSCLFDKPFICEQCGQSYRYRSAYVKHREQNHRARLPADKLFSCDVCGMQFRYLKSFKKHRLNHALEKLHGKTNAAAADSATRIQIKSEIIFDEDDEPPQEQEQQQQMQQQQQHRASDSKCDNSSEVSSSNEIVMLCNPETSLLLTTVKTENEQEKNDHFYNGAAEAQQLSDVEVEKIESEQDNTVDSMVVDPSPTSPPPSSVTVTPFRASPSSLLMITDHNRSTFETSSSTTTSSRQQRDRKFACPFCGKCVRSKENLKLHVRKHTGERPFVCLFCGRAFGGKSDLTRHLRIHTGERPYHCDMCGKCFARADYLSKHLTTHINSPSTAHPPTHSR